MEQKPERYSTLAIQTAFEFLENTCMQPAWWDGEKPIVRKLLLDRMLVAGASLVEKRKSDCLTYGGVTYDQWDYDRHEFINVELGRFKRLMHVVDFLLSRLSVKK
jgi:hypothetical protein